MRLCPRIFLVLAAQIISLAVSAETIVFTHGGPQSQSVGYYIKINGAKDGNRYLANAGQQDTYIFGNTTASIEVWQFRWGSIDRTPHVLIASFSGCNGACTHSVTVYNDGSWGGPPLTYKMSTSTINGTAYPVFYDVLVNGQKVGTSPLVDPGGEFVFNYEDSAKAEIQLVRYRYDEEGQKTDITYSRTIGANDPNWYTGDGNPPTSNSGSDGEVRVPNPPEGLNRLGFADTDDLAKEATLRRVGEVLYDSQQQGFGAVANEVRGVKGAVAGIGSQVASAVSASMGGVENKLDLIHGRLGEMKAQNDASYNKLDGIGQGIGNLGVQVNQANNTLGTIQTRIEAGNTHLTDIKQKITEGNLTLAGIEGKLVDINLNSAEGNLHLEAIKQNTQQTKEKIDAQTANDNEKAGQIVNAVTQVKDAVQSQTANDNQHHGEAQNSRQGIKDAVDLLKGQNHDDLEDLKQKLKEAIDVNTASTSNQLEKINQTLTNAPPEPNMPGQVAAGNAAGAQGRGALADLAESIQGPGSGGIGAVSENAWVIQWSFLGKTYSVDCDLRHYPAVVSLAAKVKTMLVLVLTGYYIFAIWKHAELWLATGSMVPQAKAAGVTVFGTNANTPVALAMAGAITVALFGLLAAATAAIQTAGAPNLVSGIAGEMRTGPTVWLMAMQLFDMFFPWATALSLLAQYMIFRASFTGVFWGVATSIRFLVG